MKKLFILFALLILFPENTFTQVNLNQGLLAFYPFCGNSNDLSENENDGENFGPPMLALDRFNQPSHAYSFNGVDNYIDCGNNASLNSFETGLTVCAWIYLALGGESEQHIVGKWNNTQEQDHFVLRVVDDSKILFAIGHPSFSHPGFITNTSLTVNQWHFIVASWENTGRHKVYFDTNLELDKTSSTFVQITKNSNVSFKIGSQVDPIEHFRPFIGSIDDIRIYDRVLNQGEIDVLFTDNSCDLTSISNLDDRFSFDLRPNPASEYFEIELPSKLDNYNIHIFNVMGKLVLNKRITSRSTAILQTSELPHGLYFVKVSNKAIRGNKESNYQLN